MGQKKKLSQYESKSVSKPKGKDSEKKKSLMEAWIADLASHNDARRVKARHSLVGRGKTAVPSLIEALKNKKYLIRWEAAKALGEIGDPGTAPAFVEALEDEDFDIRWLAAEGLIKLNIHALRPLLRALEKRGDSILLQEGAHHVFHDLAKGALKKYLAPILVGLEGMDPGKEVPWVALHEMGVEVPMAARQAFEMLEKEKRFRIFSE